MHTRFLTAVAAGLVSGLLFVAAARGNALSLMLLATLTPLPIAIAGFGWGWIVAAIGALTAFGLLTALASLQAGAFHLLVFSLPTTVAVYYLSLNRGVTTPAGRETVEWYPIGRVLFGIALASGLVALAALLALGTSSADLEAHIARVVEEMLKADLPWPGGKKPSGEELEKFTTYLTLSFSGAIAMSWMWMVLFNLWVGGKVARLSGLLDRPWPNVSMTALPGWAGLVLALAMAGSFLDDYAGHIASGFASGVFLAFLLVGLAIVHNVTWKNPFRPAVLVAVYAFLILFNPLSSLAVASIALIEPFVGMRNPYHGGLITKDPPEDTS